MGINLWFSKRFVSQRPRILKVKVLDFKSIKVTSFAAEKSGFPAHTDPEFRFKIFNDSPDHNFEAKHTKFGSNVQIGKLLLKEENTIFY